MYASMADIFALGRKLDFALREMGRELECSIRVRFDTGIDSLKLDFVRMVADEENVVTREFTWTGGFQVPWEAMDGRLVAEVRTQLDEMEAASKVRDLVKSTEAPE